VPGSGPQQRPAGGQGDKPHGPPQGGWGPLRDAIRRDLEQGTQALSFAERLSTMLDGQRRLFIDFPRVMEEMRSGAIERVASALSRLYEGGPGVLDLSRFLRDLPLALAHLAAGEAQARRSAAEGASGAAKRAEATPGAAAQPGGSGSAPPPVEEASKPPTDEASPEGAAQSSPAAANAAPVSESTAPATNGIAESSAAPAGGPPEAGGAAPAEPAPISPRLELRAKLLLAAPQLVRAAQSYRRNAATVRRATAPRRSPGPWRSDKEVLEQARRAIEFARQIFDAYAEAWADEPLQRNAFEATAAEADRFLAWTQLSQYMEVARAQPAAPHESRPPPDRQVVSSQEPDRAASTGAETLGQDDGEAQEPEAPSSPAATASAAEPAST
jgi:hypothetical protein